jgi:hypothetical protein
MGSSDTCHSEELIFCFFSSFLVKGKHNNAYFASCILRKTEEKME